MEAAMNATSPIRIDIVSDVVCPWCYIGQKRLDRALREIPEIATEVFWRPYQLDPTIPPRGTDRKAYMLAKFGSEERLRQIHATVKEAGEGEGIAFDFEAIKVSPNTLDAHRLIRWAASAGDGVQDRLARRLFQLFFEEGQNIGDHKVLVEAARDSGMDVAVVETLLPTEADKEAVQNEIATAGRMGIRGVPCFLLEGRYAVMGAQDPEVLAGALRQIAEAKAGGALEAVE
jgi:predicted DsbA family dithiol-disulfide isomerase